MPVEGQKWTSDPFTLTERDGKLYGRGAVDDKGQVMTWLAALRAWNSVAGGPPVRGACRYASPWQACVGGRSGAGLPSA